MDKLFNAFFPCGDLVLIEKNQTNDVSRKIVKVLRSNVNHLIVPANDVVKLPKLVSGKYKAIHIMAHATPDANDRNIITMFGQKLDLGVSNDYYVDVFKNTLTSLLEHTDTIVMYTCLLGDYEKIRQICIDITEHTNKSIYLSSNITGVNDWLVEWKAESGVGKFLTDNMDLYKTIFTKLPKNIVLGASPFSLTAPILNFDGIMQNQNYYRIGQQRYVIGTAGNQYLIGEGGKVYLIGEGGKQTLIGEGGKIALIGEGGKISLIGENGKTYMVGINGRYRITII